MDQKLLDAIEQLKRGEERGFNYIYSMTCQSVYSQASNYLKNKADVEDVVQAVYIAVYQSIGTLNDPNAFYGWLKMIVRNQACSVIRRFKDDVSLEEGMEEYQGVEWEQSTDMSTMPESSAEQKAVSEMVANIIEDMPDPYKSVITMSLYENMTQEEIAKALDCPVNTVKTWNRKAKEIMKSKVEAIEKRDGVRLHALSIPTILLAYKLLAEREPMKAKAAESVLDGIRQTLTPVTSVTSGMMFDADGNLITMGNTGGEAFAQTPGVFTEFSTNIAESSASVVESLAVPAAKTATKGVGLGAKIAGLSAKAKAIAAVGTLVVGGATAVVTPKVIDAVNDNKIAVEAPATPGLSHALIDESVGTKPEQMPDIKQEVDTVITPDIVPEATPTITPEVVEEEKVFENIRYIIKNGEATILGLINDSQLENLIIPEQIEGCPVTRIAEGAFAGNRVLKTVEMPNSVVEVGKSTFRSCSSLEMIKLSDSLKNIPRDFCCLCKNLKEIEFPQALETIELGAFADNEKLERVVLKSAKTIGDKAFYRCKNLREVVFPDNLEQIGKQAFSDCDLLNEVVFQNGLKKIDTYAFAGCSTITEIIMPDSLELLGENAFDSCTSLVRIELSKGLKQLPRALFYRCTALEKIVVPGNIETIGRDVWGYNSKLKNVVIQDGVKTIGYAAFYECDSLEEISFPDSVTKFEDRVFLGCGNLKRVNLPSKLQNLPERVFGGCTSLYELELPGSVTTIGQEAFWYCGIQKIHLHDTLSRIDDYAFPQKVPYMSADPGSYAETWAVDHGYISE